MQFTCAQHSIAIVHLLRLWGLVNNSHCCKCCKQQNICAAEPLVPHTMM